MNSRAQSETIGVVLLVGIVVISVSTVGVFALSNIQRDTVDADISVQVSTRGVFFSHGGGESLAMGDLLVVVRDGDRTLRLDFTADTIYDGDDDDVFEPGERWANVDQTFDLDTPVTVSLFDTRRNTLLAEDTRYPVRNFAAGPTPPTARASIDRDPAYAEDPSTFDATASEDPDGSIVAYTWTFGDGTTASGATVAHTYDSPGTYNVTLRVEDDVGIVDTTTRELTVLPAQPQVESVSVSNAPLNQSDVGSTQTITVTFDRPMDTATTPTVELRNLSGTVSYTGAGAWSDNETFVRQVDVSDADEESLARVNVTGGADETGSVTEPDNSTTVLVDTQVPTISDYSVTSPSDPTIVVNFTSSEQLSDVLVELSVQQRSFTAELTADDFTETAVGDGTYTYNASYDAPARGDYTATLVTAEDQVANDGAGDESGTVTIDTGTGEPVVETFSALTASSDRDLVTIGNLTVVNHVQTEDLQSVEIVVREAGSTTVVATETLDPAGVDRLSREDVTLSGPIVNGTTYNVTVNATSTNGKSTTQTKQVTGEETLSAGSPTIDAFSDISISSGRKTVTVGTLNASDDAQVSTVNFTVYNVGGSVVGQQRVTVNSPTATLSNVQIDITGTIRSNEEYTVNVTVTDSDGNSVSRAETRTAGGGGGRGNANLAGPGSVVAWPSVARPPRG